MPRLLILCEYPTLLGGERSMLATLDVVTAAGFDVHVAAPPAGPLAQTLRQRGIAHAHWLTHGQSGVRLPLDQLRSDLWVIFNRIRPDLVHANSLSTARIAGPVAARSNVASIGHLRDIIKLAPQAVADLNAHRRLIAVSRATRDFHVVQGIDATKCVVVHNGVDLEQFRPRAPTGYLHRELNLPAGARLVATVGQLSLRKGTDVSLSAAWKAAHELPDAHWLIVGERTSNKQEAVDLQKLLHELADERPLAGRAHFLGSREDVAELLSECELLVHAARQEPLGRVLLEAAACGVAIIATDVGGTREIFPGDDDGALLVRPDDGTALATAIVAILEDADRRRSMSRAARRRAEQAFHIRSAARRLVEQYQLALAGAS
jgi:glycosyltransferase involved in cell wall biosynthesis